MLFGFLASWFVPVILGLIALVFLIWLALAIVTAVVVAFDKTIMALDRAMTRINSRRLP